ncbi:12718_t:CDS:1, partial [Gigaspora margarita]
NQAALNLKIQILQFKQLDAIVHVCNKALLGHNGSRSLIAVVPTLFCEYLIANHKNKINESMDIQIHIEILI